MKSSKLVRYSLLIVFFLAFFPLKARESVCVTCHTELEGSLKQPVIDWKTSTHYETGISCHNCHGGNPDDEDLAMSPEFGFAGTPSESEVPDFCGKCHVQVRQNYTRSPHSEMLGEGGPSCVTCHTAHKQERATITLINTELCGKCHSFERAEKIKYAMSSTEAKILSLDKRIDELWARGFNVENQKGALFATKNAFRSLTHVIDVDLILAQTGGFQADLGKIEEEVSKKEGIVGMRKIWGVLLIILFLLSAFFFHNYRKYLRLKE